VHAVGATTVVLVEGVSDQVAVTTLARSRALDLAAQGVDVVPMGGATNIGHFVRRYADRTGVRLAGLCDLAETRFYRRALGGDYFVCARDLEDELIRALGARAVQHVVEAERELPAFRVFQRQPAQRHKPVEDQLRRFLGTHSGRKARYAGALVQALPPGTAPPPLEGLLGWLRRAPNRVSS
jgi:hypothetical protein